MNWIVVIGLVAGACTTFSFLPQLVKLLKTKSSTDISTFMFIILVTGIALWLAYGILIKSIPVIAANAVSFCLVLSILYFTIKFKKKMD